MIIRQKVLPIVGLGDDVWIWEGSIVYEVLFFMPEAEAIVGFMARFLMEVTIIIKVPSRRYDIRHGRGI